MQKYHREILKGLDALDVVVDDVGLTARGHLRISLSYQGKKRRFVTAGTSSDRKGIHNFKSDITRWMNGISHGN
jgi:hypothetical protein